MTRTGSLYCPLSRSRTTVSRSVVSASSSGQITAEAPKVIQNQIDRFIRAFRDDRRRPTGLTHCNNSTLRTRTQSQGGRFRSQRGTQDTVQVLRLRRPLERAGSRDLGRAGGQKMTVVVIEARPRGASEGTPVDDYVIEDHSDGILAAFKTQAEAISWARSTGTPHTSPAFDTSTTKRNLITGELFSRGARCSMAPARCVDSRQACGGGGSNRCGS